jgi:hypothetical protein
VRRTLAGLAVVAALVADAFARPGGGDSFSGGGGHGDGSGGGDGSGVLELLYWLIRLAIHYPYIGVPLIALVIGWFIYSSYKQHQNKDWDSGPPVALERAIDLDDVKRVDPDFSQVLFEDFAFRLFSTAHRARHSQDTLASIAPYVAQEAQLALHTRQPATEPVLAVVVGAMRVCQLDIPSVLGDRNARVRIAIEFEATVTTARHTYYSVERWRFARDASRRSRPPPTGRADASRGFPCPNCSAPWQASASGTQVCASCGQAVDNGRFDWVVDSITLRAIDQRPPTLATAVPERGTELPTYRQDDIDARLIQLGQTDPEATEQALQGRLAMIYDQLNRAWASNDLRPARGLISDGLYDYLSYWIEAYKRQDLRNELADMRLVRTTIARVSRDRWYDSVVIRIWATGKDFVVRISNGALVRGSKRRERNYSEYWTLIRSAQRKGPTLTKPICSNCGAPLQISMAGECEHCSAHVTSGEFDWVLSKIEQDDSYRG